MKDLTREKWEVSRRNSDERNGEREEEEGKRKGMMQEKFETGLQWRRAVQPIAAASGRGRIGTSPSAMFCRPTRSELRGRKIYRQRIGGKVCARARRAADGIRVGKERFGQHANSKNWLVHRILSTR